MKLRLLYGLLVFLLIFQGSCTPPQFNEDQWKKEVEAARPAQLYEKHQRNGIFFNPWMADNRRSFISLLRWRLSFKQAYTEEEHNFLPKYHKNVKEQIRTNINKDFIVWIGHGSYLIKTGDQVWLLDPMFSKRALLPARKVPPALTTEDINSIFPRVNVVISHNHYDHLDEESIRNLSDTTVFYVPMGLGATLRDWQPKAKIVEMDWWDRLTLTDGYELHCLPSQHWSLRVFESANNSLWASYMIVTPKRTVYFGGDSGYFIGYQEFGKKYPSIDYALLPTTAYHPRWFMHYAHMNIDEAVQAFIDLGAKFFIPTQWGTFQLGDNPPGYPILDLKRHISQYRLDPKKFLIPHIGQLIVMD